MNVEVLMSNPFFVRLCQQGSPESLEMLKSGLSDSVKDSIEFVIKG